MEGFPQVDSNKEQVTGLENTEFYKQTVELETGIEKNSATLPGKFRDFGKKILAALVRRGRTAAEAAVILAALMPNPAFAEDVEEGLGIENGTNVTSLEKSTSEGEALGGKRELTAAEEEKIEKDLNLDITEIATNAGFTVSLEVPSSNGKYIIHVDQRHFIDNADEDAATRIINSQKKIETALRLLSQNGHRDVFLEGQTAFNEGATWYHFVEERMKEVKIDNNFFSNLQIFLENELKKNNYLPQDVQARGDIIIMYTVKKYANTIKQQLVDNDTFTEEQENQFQTLIQNIEPPGKYADYGDDAIYLVANQRRLIYEGVINGHPAETVKANDEAIAALKEYNKAVDAYISADPYTLPLEEIDRLKNAYSEAKEKYNTIAIENREFVALNEINHFSKTNNEQKAFVLVYGLGHDFANNMKAQNDTRDNDGKMGLIRLNDVIKKAEK